jgi:excisionase family DNA binding protein
VSPYKPVIPAETIMTTGDIARLMRVRQETVKHWCDCGLLKSFRTPGGHRRIYASAFREALAVAAIPIRKS